VVEPVEAVGAGGGGGGSSFDGAAMLHEQLPLAGGNAKQVEQSCKSLRNHLATSKQGWIGRREAEQDDARVRRRVGESRVEEIDCFADPVRGAKREPLLRLQRGGVRVLELVGVGFVHEQLTVFNHDRDTAAKRATFKLLASLTRSEQLNLEHRRGGGGVTASTTSSRSVARFRRLRWIELAPDRVRQPWRDKPHFCKIRHKRMKERMNE